MAGGFLPAGLCKFFWCLLDMKHIHTEKHCLPSRMSGFWGFFGGVFCCCSFWVFSLQNRALLWLRQGHAFFFSVWPVHVRALASSLVGVKEKAVLQSCQPGVAAWVSSPLHLCIALWWCFSGASHPGKASQEVLKGQGGLWGHGGLCMVGFIHWHNTPFDDAGGVQGWRWMGHSSWCQGSAVECWLSTLRAIPLSSAAVPVKCWLHTSSGAPAFCKLQKWSSPLGRQFLICSCGAGVNCVEVGSSLVKCPQHQSVTNISSPFPGAFGGIQHPSDKAVSRWPQHMAHVLE